jgi:hypothetical protein
MESIAQAFAEGGWGMYPVLFLGLIAVPAALALPSIGIATARPTLGRVFAILLAALGLFAIGGGVLGWQSGLHTMEAALRAVNPADRETIRMAGQSEARVCLIFGLMTAALPLAGAVLLLGVAFRKPPWLPAAGALAVLLSFSGAVVWQIGVRRAEKLAAHRGTEAAP